MGNDRPPLITQPWTITRDYKGNFADDVVAASTPATFVANLDRHVVSGLKTNDSCQTGRTTIKPHQNCSCTSFDALQ